MVTLGCETECLFFFAVELGPIIVSNKSSNGEYLVVRQNKTLHESIHSLCVVVTLNILEFRCLQSHPQPRYYW